MKIAVYLDEVADDPIEACEQIKLAGLQNICLRQVRSYNVAEATDDACQNLIQTIRKYEFNVICVASCFGRLSQKNLMPIPEVQRAIQIAAYFKAKYLRFFNGLGRERADKQLAYWMNYISNECLKSNVIPLLEIDPEATIQNPLDIEALLKAYPSWRLLYDPALLVLRHRIDPYILYWSKLKSYIAAADLHDYKIGSGLRLIGSGDCRWLETLKDMKQSGYDGYLLIEHGMRHSLKSKAKGPHLLRAILDQLNRLIS